MYEATYFNGLQAVSYTHLDVYKRQLMDDIIFDGEVEYFADLGYALAVHDIELSLFEGRSDFVLDYLSPVSYTHLHCRCGYSYTRSGRRRTS